MTLVLDAGALVALARNERQIWTRLKASQLAGEPPLTHAGVVGQVWRGGPRQARLSQALTAVDVRALDERLGRSAGELLGASGRSDVVDAALALICQDGDDIATSDRDDFRVLMETLRLHVELIRP